VTPMRHTTVVFFFLVALSATFSLSHDWALNLLVRSEVSAIIFLTWGNIAKNPWIEHDMESPSLSNGLSPRQKCPKGGLC